jgi:hypothetical protein
MRPSREDTTVMPTIFLDKVVIQVRMEYQNTWNLPPELVYATIHYFKDDNYQQRTKHITYYGSKTYGMNNIDTIPKKYLDALEFGKKVACDFDIDASIVQQNFGGWRNKWIRYAPDGKVLQLDSNKNRVFDH